VVVLVIISNNLLKKKLNVLIEDVPDVVMSNWMLWIPAMMINFKFVPGK